MPSTQHDPIVDEERMLTGRPIVTCVAEHYLEVIHPPPRRVSGAKPKYYVKKGIGAVFEACAACCRLSV